MGVVTWRPEGFSYEVANGFFGANHGAGGFGFFGAAGIEFVGDKAIVVFIDDLEEFEPKVVEGFLVHVAFEDAVLDAHAVVLADFGGLGEAFLIGNVVSDHGQHFVFSRRTAFIGDMGEGLAPPIPRVFDG